MGSEMCIRDSFLALTQVRILGAITPIGGVLFIIGWLVLVIATLKFAG